MRLIHSRLTNKLRMSTGVLVVAMLASSCIAYVKMRQVSALSSSVVEKRVPTLDAVRALRRQIGGTTSSLKSYLLFGIDPALAGRYRDEWSKNWSEAHNSMQQVEELNGKLDLGEDRPRLSAILGECRSLEQSETAVEKMAIGQGGDASGQAFDKLRTEVADREAKLDTSLQQVIESQTKKSSTEMEALTAANRSEAVVLWIATIVGVLVGGFIANMLAARIVGSIKQVAERAETIAEGNLTSSELVIDSRDEVAGLAQSVNRMQDNLRETISTMAEIAATVSGNSAALSNSANASFRRTEEQTQQTQQAAAAMQEMSISIAEVSRHAQSAAETSRSAARTAREGGTIVEHVLANIQSIAASVRTTASTVQRLGKESEQIIRIVNVIEEIAQKTNLLALNAAIEAARAGEQGRGFAVVAGEVRRLAESTRDATSEIGQMIQGIQVHTREAVESMDAGTTTVEEGVQTTARAGDALQRIIEMADQVDGMIAQIATAAAQQADAAQQSSANLDVINKLSGENAAAIPETKGIVTSVESGAKRLQEHIGHFRIEEQGVSSRRQGQGMPRALVAEHAYGD